jgi:rSAM/selenodomain-associated transferase 2
VRIAVIIPALNEEPVICAAVTSAWDAGAAEVILADGGSDDRTVELAQERRCKVVVAPKGRAFQQNAGARVATADVLLFLHADNRLGASACQQVRDALTRPDVVCGAFRQRIEARGFGYRLLERGNSWRVRWLGLPYGDQAIFLRRGLFEEVGGFPEVRLMEDLVLMTKLRRKAWPILLPGPLLVDARRWQRHGIIRQTLRNWWLLAAYKFGTTPDQPADYYKRHDQ